MNFENKYFLKKFFHRVNSLYFMLSFKENSNIQSGLEEVK